MSVQQSDTVCHTHCVSGSERARQKAQTPSLICFTGLSGAGKSTLANLLEVALFKRHYHSYLLDGDNLRSGLNRDLGFSDADRIENIRRVGEVSRLMVDAGLIVLSAFIAPFRRERAILKALMPEGRFIEVFVDAPLEICESRDPKGLYRRARQGYIKNFTGIDSAYETPESPDVHIYSDRETPEQACEKLLRFLENKHLITADQNKSHHGL